jgi:hypothetical protein
MYTGRPHGSSGPVPLIILGVVFLVIGFVVPISIPAARSVLLLFQLLGAIFIIGGVVWLLVQRSTAGKGYLPYGNVPPTQYPIQPMSPAQPTPNTLSGMAPGSPVLDPATGQPAPNMQGTVMTGPMVYSGGALNPAVIQQLTQMGMALAGEALKARVMYGTANMTMSPMVIDLRNAMQHQMQIMGATGNPGRATIKGVHQLGTAADGQQLCELELDVQPATGASYPLTYSVVVPAAAAGRVVAGASLPVHIDPATPSQISVDWGAA